MACQPTLGALLLPSWPGCFPDPPRPHRITTSGAFGRAIHCGRWRTWRRGTAQEVRADGLVCVCTKPPNPKLQAEAEEGLGQSLPSAPCSRSTLGWEPEICRLKMAFNMDMRHTGGTCGEGDGAAFRPELHGNPVFLSFGAYKGSCAKPLSGKQKAWSEAPPPRAIVLEKPWKSLSRGPPGYCMVQG